MKDIFNATPYRWRYFFVCLLLSLAVIALLARIAFLSVIDRRFLLNQGNARVLRIIDIPAYRGMITDRNNNPLAVSTPVESIWVDPRKFAVSDQALKRLCHLLDLNFSDTKTLLKKNQQREFVYLKRRVDPWLARQVKKLNVTNIFLQEEYRRYYPEGEATAHVLGFTNVDEHGQEGLELAFEKWLAGAPGKRRVMRDRYGNIVADVANLREPHPGNNLTLSIDRRIQYVAYKALSDGISEFAAQSGSAVVLDTQSGEILAMVNYPSFNPNENDLQVSEDFRNRAVTDVFEPGSTMKAFSIGSAIASGKYRANSMIDTGKGYFMVGKNVVRDEHPLGVVSVKTILQRSSNVGTAKIVLSLPSENLWDMLKSVGFGESTNSGFPGERSGILSRHRLASPFLIATLAFGYGISVTPIQLAQAYQIIANHGVKMPLTCLRREQPVVGKRTMSKKTADEMRELMRSVVEDAGGTAPLARVPGYHIAGKTGTAHLVGPHGYEKNHYMAVFVGMAPATKPRLVVAVVIKDPTKKAYLGGFVAGPIFSQIMGGALRTLEIPPDNLASAVPEKADQVKSVESEEEG